MVFKYIKKEAHRNVREGKVQKTGAKDLEPKAQRENKVQGFFLSVVLCCLHLVYNRREGEPRGERKPREPGRQERDRQHGRRTCAESRHEDIGRRNYAPNTAARNLGHKLCTPISRARTLFRTLCIFLTLLSDLGLSLSLIVYLSHSFVRFRSIPLSLIL